MEAIKDILSTSQNLGFLGPGSIDDYLSHCQGFLDVIQENNIVTDDVLDLGSGGGIPGLFLSTQLPNSRFVLLDASIRRCQFLSEAVQSLNISSRVQVICERAEITARNIELRGSFSLVVARGFGQPSVTAECAVPFLKVGGVLLVSEPPSTQVRAGIDADAIRWPREGCAKLGLVVESKTTLPYSFIQLRLTDPCPDRYPRRNGVPSKKPLF